jgi:uncharacterized integral membrane protein
MKIDKKDAQKKLIKLWLIGSLILFLIFLFETINTKNYTDLKEPWLWFMPNIISPLSLMIGVMIAESTIINKKSRTVDKFFYTLSFTLSFFYILLILCTIVLHVFVDMKTIEFFRLSNIWLFPIQGLTVSSLGVFFVKGQ